MKSVPGCPACRAAKWAEVIGGDDSYRLFRCVECGCHRIDKGIAGAAGVYAQYYSEASAERLAGPFSMIWRWKRRSRARLILRHTLPGGSVCDVGCERGELLNLLKRAGCRVAGTQLSNSAADFARRHFFIDVFVGELMDAPFAGDRFEAIVMLNILEHLPDPERYVAQAARMLPPGGTLWLELPNAGSWTARLCGKRWLHHDPPHHMWSFNLPGVLRLIRRHGFVVDQVYPHNWEFNPIGCVQSWLNWLPGRKNVLFDVVRRGFSRDSRPAAREALDVILAGALLPMAVLVAWFEGVSGNGQVLLIRARRSEAAV